MIYNQFMHLALREARQAQKKDEVPVGAVLIQNGKVLARGHNLTRTHRDPTAHAEMVVLKKAARKIRNERLLGTTLYVTLEPCAMCAGAIIQARIPVVVFGAKDPKAGACGSVLKVLPHKKLNHRPQVVKGVMAKESAQILKDFFRRKRG
jgi:tRNA(adenine34) deaminase